MFDILVWKEAGSSRSIHRIRSFSTNDWVSVAALVSMYYRFGLHISWVTSFAARVMLDARTWTYVSRNDGSLVCKIVAHELLVRLQSSTP